jgi:DNA-binding GntR family transcriptional regulator
MKFNLTTNIVNNHDSHMLTPRGPLSEEGYEELRDAILDGTLRPGERLVEAELSERFSLGRGAVRMAIVRLTAEGLVEREHYRGAKVRAVTAVEAIAILETREVLEGLTARAAAEKATNEDIAHLKAINQRMQELIDEYDLVGAYEQNKLLHQRILHIAQHPVANRMLATLRSQLVQSTFNSIYGPGRPQLSAAEHRAIVDAIAARDPVAAERAMREHLAHVTDALRAVHAKSQVDEEVA